MFPSINIYQIFIYFRFASDVTLALKFKKAEVLNMSAALKVVI